MHEPLHRHAALSGGSLMNANGRAWQWPLPWQLGVVRDTHSGITLWEQASAMADCAFRTKCLEELHARMTGFSDAEMRCLMTEVTAKLAHVLQTRDTHRGDFQNSSGITPPCMPVVAHRRAGRKVTCRRDHFVPDARKTHAAIVEILREFWGGPQNDNTHRELYGHRTR